MFTGAKQVFTTVSTVEEVSQILELQANNLEVAIDPEQAIVEGFVTIKHDPDVLRRMCQQKPAIIAKSGEKVVGYAIIMLPAYAEEVPILKPMFDMMAFLQWQDKPLRESSRWFVMGQICVEKAFRGKGIFYGMYLKMKEVYAGDFDFTITEVAERNTRSIRAHERAGFKTLHQYYDDLSGEFWRLLVLDF